MESLFRSNKTSWRFVCTVVLAFLGCSSATLAQESISPGCETLQDAPAFDLMHGGGTTGKYPNQMGKFFYQGDAIGAAWSTGVQMQFTLWTIGTQQDTSQSFPASTSGSITVNLTNPSNYYAVQLTNVDTNPDNDDFGINWTCTPKPAPKISQTHDFDGNGNSDIAFMSSTGTVALWLMNGGAISSTGNVATVPGTFSIIGQRDFDGDGKADLLWRDNSGNLAIWFMNGATLSSSANLGTVSSTWSVKGTGGGDILWQDASGDLAVWFMVGRQITSTAVLGTVAPATGWTIVATNDNGCLLWRDGSGDLALWQLNGSAIASSSLGTVTSNWQVLHLGDFNGDGVPDLLFRDTNTGTLAMWFLNASGTVQSTAGVATVSPGTWTVVDTGDYNGDGKSDILWKDSSNNLAVWYMNSAAILSSAGLGNIGATWTVQTQNAE